jgi:hypothetical protein
MSADELSDVPLPFSLLQLCNAFAETPALVAIRAFSDFETGAERCTSTEVAAQLS